MKPWLRYAVVFAFAATPAVAVDVTYEVGVRTDARGRTPVAGDRGTILTGDLELAPRAQLRLGIDASSFQFQYAPTLLWREPTQPFLKEGSLLPLHRARLAFETRWPRGVFLIAEDAAYGETYVGALRNPEGATEPVAELQNAGMVSYLRSYSTVGIESRPSDRLTLGVSGGYQVSGSPEPVKVLPPDPAAGPDAPVVIVAPSLPFQYGPFLLANARVTVGRLDGLTTAAQVSQAHFNTGADQLVAQLRELWDRRLSRTVTLTLGAGAALTREDVVRTTLARYPGRYLDVLPLAQAGLDWRDVLAGHPVRLDATLRMAPFTDRFTASVYERVELRGHGEWRFAKDWLTTAAAGGAIAVPVSLSILKPEGAPASPQLGDRVLYAEGTVAWTVKTWLILQASARVLWTEQPRTMMPGQVQAAGTVSVTVMQQDSLAW